MSTLLSINEPICINLLNYENCLDSINNTWNSHELCTRRIEYSSKNKSS